MLTAYYDGGCPLCRREIAFLRRRVAARDVTWVDVAALPGDRVAADLERSAALARFHVRLEDGRLVSGVPAFASLWQRASGLRWLGRLAGVSLLRRPLEWAYRGFLVLRPRLQSLMPGTTCSVDGACDRPADGAAAGDGVGHPRGETRPAR